MHFIVFWFICWLCAWCIVLFSFFCFLFFLTVAREEMGCAYFYTEAKETFMWRQLQCRTCLEMSIACNLFSHLLRAYQEHGVVAGLLDNLKWNNSVRRAELCGCMCAPAKGGRAWKVFLTNRIVNSPSCVHILFMTGVCKGAGGNIGEKGVLVLKGCILHLMSNPSCIVEHRSDRS